MLIASRDSTQFFNLDNLAGIFVGRDGKIIVACPDGRNMALESYGSEQYAKAAFLMLTNRVKMALQNDVHMVWMPTDDEVQAQLNKSDAPYRSLTGKKPTRHGGS